MDANISKSLERSKTIPEVAVTSLAHFIDSVESLSKHWREVAKRRFAEGRIVGEKFPGEIVPWFRGVSDSQYALEPGLLRDRLSIAGGNLFTRDQIRQVEAYMLRRFKAAGLPFTRVPTGSEIDWLFLMQHHGLPTRLLDWSKNALIGLYFAVRKHEKKQNEVAVWVLDPRRLNEACQLGRSITFPHTDQQRKVEEYCSLQYSDNDPTYPIPLIPEHVSSRLVAQHSRFTLHTERRCSLFQFATDLHAIDHTWYLAKILVRPSCQASIVRALRLTGIAEIEIMPGLDSLATDILQRITFGATDFV